MSLTQSSTITNANEPEMESLLKPQTNFRTRLPDHSFKDLMGLQLKRLALKAQRFDRDNKTRHLLPMTLQDNDSFSSCSIREAGCKIDKFQKLAHFASPRIVFEESVHVESTASSSSHQQVNCLTKPRINNVKKAPFQPPFILPGHS